MKKRHNEHRFSVDQCEEEKIKKFLVAPVDEKCFHNKESKDATDRNFPHPDSTASRLL